MSFTSFSILTMLIFSSITYRFGVGAVWLYGVERGLRALFMLVGRWVSNFFFSETPSGIMEATAPKVIIVVLVIVATVILLSERDLASKWGIAFFGSQQDGEEIFSQQALADTCARIGKKYGLSSREEEVLLLLARRQRLPLIEKELFIANGTVKAHIRHIYRKLGIHTRKELFEMLGMNTRRAS
jgi:DNA-binding CsgD family transcriptional regulator